MFGDTLQRGVQGVRDRLPETERGQVGIGTLIVFIAMVLVAAIAAGVLINTAGFLQSKSQQAGEESSSQVTNQLQVVSQTGIVNNGDQSSAEMLTLGVKEGNNGGNDGASAGTLPVDSGTEVTLTIDGQDGGTSQDASEIVLTTANIDGELTIGDPTATSTSNELTRTVTITRFEGDDGTERVRLTNDNTGASLTFDAGDTIELRDSDATQGNEQSATEDTNAIDVTFSVTYDDSTFGETTIEQSIEVPDQSGSNNVYSVPTIAENRTESYIQLVDGSSVSSPNQNTIRVNDGEEVTVSDSDSGVLTNGDQELSVSPENTLVFDVTGEKEFTVTNQDTGASIVVENDDNFGATSGSNAIDLTDGSQTVSLTSGDVDFQTLAGIDEGSGPDRYLFTRDLVDSTAVTQVNLLVAGSAGAGDIDISQTVISTRTPQGSFTLNYGQTTIENEQFTIEAVPDADDTAPILTSGDRFRLKLDLGALEGGSTASLRITTNSGATKVVQLRVPDSLANKEAVGL